jgi:hypothetical protein
MFDRIGSLGDRLLSAIVPKTRADAASCRYERCGSPCHSRYCCYGTGIPEYARCGSCLYRC